MICYYGSVLLGSYVRSQTHLPMKPAFTGDFLERSFVAEGVEFPSDQPRSREVRFIFARRSDGSTVRANVDPKDGSVIYARSVKIVPQRKMEVVADAIESVSTTHYPHPIYSQRHLRHDPETNCLPDEASGEVFLGNDQYLGIAVVKSQVDNATVRRAHWRAPELGCHDVKTVSKWKDPRDGSIISTTERTALSIQRGEPSSELFEIANHYQEKPPSQLDGDLADHMSGRTSRNVTPGSPAAIAAQQRKWDHKDSIYFYNKRYAPPNF